MRQRAVIPILVAACAAACTVTVQQPAPAPQPVTVVQQTPPPAPPPQPVAPPPAPEPSRVGRLGFMLGTVSFRAAETDEWAPAEPNWPLASGDRIWTDMDSRAEVDFGAVVMRVGPQSELDVVQLDDRTVQVRLPQGTLTERVLGASGDEHEIDAPNAAVSVDRPGVYRIDVSPDGMTTTVTVWGGEATVSEAGSSFVVNARQAATVNGSGDAPTFRLADAAPPDAFDRWGMERDAERDRLAEAGQPYIPAGMPGANELGAYGRWEVDPAIGPVWYPTTVSASWAPYRTGHWAFVRPWGWTWVDAAPWGYAPYHYGRWLYRNGGWAWSPGRPTNARPAYAPALVQFVSAPGPNGPTVAWVPAGNQNVPTAVTVVQQQTFASQLHVEQHLVANATHVTGVVDGVPPVQPVRIVPVSRAVPPPAILARPVVAVHPPPAERHDIVIIHPAPRMVAAAPTANQPKGPAQEPTAPPRLAPHDNGRAWKAGQVSPALDADYDRKKSELEERHRAEIEHPREGETTAQRDARHEQEKRDLDAAYEKAKMAGATSIPNGEQ